jgi:hypothetical protein
MEWLKKNKIPIALLFLLVSLRVAEFVVDILFGEGGDGRITHPVYGIMLTRIYYFIFSLVLFSYIYNYIHEFFDTLFDCVSKRNVSIFQTTTEEKRQKIVHKRTNL